jgi:RNA polymerase sigma-70 factor, ECF subfamily
MNAKLQPGTATEKEAPPTLGSLLYRDASKPRTSEKEWVELVRAVAEGDTTAFGTLYMWSHGIVFTSIVRITGDRTVAEDLMVDVFHDVWCGAPNYQPSNGPVIAWIMNLARSRALDRQRSDKGIGPAAMRAAVETLTTGERRAIEDVFFSGLTYVEVAAREGVLTNMIKSRIRSGLGRLRTVLARGFGRR